MAGDDLVRPSRDGDQFHYHWAARHCLSLLPGLGDLVAISIEGASVAEGGRSVEDGDELIDVGFYYGSENVEDARSVHYVQLKHSTRHASTPWTASGLKKTLKGFAKRYTGLSSKFSAETLQEKFKFTYTTNRPIDIKVKESIEDLRHAQRSRHPTVRQSLIRYTGLSISAAKEFFKIFSVEEGEPGLWAQRNLLSLDIAVYLAGTDYDSPVQLKELVSRKATSEFAHDPSIRRHDVLRALKVTEPELLPAQCLIASPTNAMSREQEGEILAYLLTSTQSVVLHADGGVGKSVLASRLAALMPNDSVAVLYDCFGDGLYRNVLHYRHRHRDALVQIANELASLSLCHPLIPSAHVDAKDLMRAFLGRLNQAIAVIRGRDPDACLCLLIDAADNADMVAEELGERAFVRDLIQLELPDGVKLVMTCRTHRRERLGSLVNVHQIELKPFSKAETAMHLRCKFPDATEANVAEFAFLTSSNPRVQALALSRGLPMGQMLRELGPAPSTVESAIGDLLQLSVEKLKEREGNTEVAQIDLICQGLAVLRPLVPVSVLAQISGISEGAVRSFAYDLDRPLVVKGDSLHFLDEPTETWFRERFKPTPAILASFLERLRPLAKSSSYVASTIPQLLLSAGYLDELVELALSEDGLPTTNPIERRDVELQRLTFALKACLQKRRYADAAKLALKGGGEAAGESRQIKLIQTNTDIAAHLLAPDRIEELVSRRTFDGGWMGAHHAYDAGLLSGRDQFKAEAGSHLRMAMDWLYAWSRRPQRKREAEQVDDADRAEIAMAYLRVEGPEEATKFLSRWKPRRLAFDASRLLASRLVDLGQLDQLDLLAIHSANNLWILLGLITEAARIGHCIPPEPMARVMRVLMDQRVKLNKNSQWEGRWELLDAVTSAVATSLKVLPRQDDAWADLLCRYLPERPPSELTDRFGSHRGSLLRAYALESALRGKSLLLVDIAPPDIRDEMENKASRGGGGDAAAFRLAIGGVLSWYVLAAEISCGRAPADLASAIEQALKATESAASKDYQGQFNIHQVAAVEWIRILNASSTTDTGHVDVLRAWCHARREQWWPATLTAMCWIAARAKGMQDFSLVLAIAAFETLENSREHADSRADDYLRLARAVFPANSNEAAAYFDRAVEISSRIGDENLDRWSALLHLAEAAAQRGASRSRSAYRLSRAAELTYEYVARDKHFDWNRTVDALLSSCPSSTFSILSRWRDRDFGDAGRLIGIAVHSLVHSGELPAFAPLVLYGLDAGWDGLTDIQQAVLAETDQERRKLMLQIGYRYLRVEPQKTDTWIGLAELGRSLKLELLDLDRLIAAAEAESASKTTPGDHSDLDDEPKAIQADWDTLFAEIDFSSPEDLRKAYKGRSSIAPGSTPVEFFQQALQHSGMSRSVGFVRAIAAWPDFGLFELRYLLDAIPKASRKLLSLRKALNEATLAACRNTPEYARRTGWGNVFPFEDLYRDGIVSEDEVVGAVLQSFEKIEAFDAADFFLLIDPLSFRLRPDEADGVLNFGLDLLEDILEPEDGDGPWTDDLMPPSSCLTSLAGYLWVSLGSPTASERWKAAHVIRACIELDWRELLLALVERADAGNGIPFTDQGLPFYEWHAQQWLLIALARGALDRPEAVIPFVPYLKRSAAMKHVLIRHFARETLLVMHRTGAHILEDVPELQAVNASQLPLLAGQRWQRKRLNETCEDGGVSDDEKYYFGIDISPYWFAPLGEVFGLSETSIEVRARRVLRDQMPITYALGRDDPRYKRKLFPSLATSHSHGSMPRVDDLRAYHAYHAMMLVAADLLETHPVGTCEYEVKNDFQVWLQSRLLTRVDGRWLADRRDPNLTNPPIKLQGDSAHSWYWRVTKDYLHSQLRADDGLQVLYGHWSSGHRDDVENIKVQSAFVSKDSAAALLAALQTSPVENRFYIPRADESEPAGEAFRISAWVTDENLSAQLDEYDPWAAKMDYPGPQPLPHIISELGLTACPDLRRWRSPSGALLRSESWTRSVGYGRDHDHLSGTRLSCDSSFLGELLQAHPHEQLLICVSVRRVPPRDNEAQFEPYPWPYEHYYLIGNDEITRTL
jgi:hypothetical protein